FLGYKHRAVTPPSSSDEKVGIPALRHTSSGSVSGPVLLALYAEQSALNALPAPNLAPTAAALRSVPVSSLEIVLTCPGFNSVLAQYRSFLHYLDRLREGETRAKRASRSLTHHLECSRATPPSTVATLCRRSPAETHHSSIRYQLVRSSK